MSHVLGQGSFSIRIFHLAFHEFGAFVQRHAQAEAALQQALV
jgi:hypothetical protein